MNMHSRNLLITVIFYYCQRTHVNQYFDVVQVRGIFIILIVKALRRHTQSNVMKIENEMGTSFSKLHPEYNTANGCEN